MKTSRPYLNRVRPLAATVVVASAALGVGSARAESLAPWWGVTSGAQPTNLSASSGRDEVQRLRVSATKGDYLLADFSTFLVAVVPFDASASEVQQTLETIYPTRSVLVEAEPSGEEDTRVYAIHFPAQAVAPVLALPDSEELAEIFGGEPLTGGKEEATVVEVQEGANTANTIVLTAENRGDAGTSGVTELADELPAGLEAVGIEGVAGTAANSRGPVNCTYATLSCTYSEECSEGAPCSLPPFEQIEVRIPVVVRSGAGGANTATVSGGGAARAVTASHALHVGGAQAFGFDDYELIPEEAGGLTDTQAGSHPFQLTSVVTLNTQAPEPNPPGAPRSAALPENISAELPPGLIGNPTPFAQCTDAQFSEQAEGEHPINKCPDASAVGVAVVTFNEPQALHYQTSKVPIFNMTPRKGEPARFGFTVEGVASAFLDTSLRTGGDYGVTVSSAEISEIAWVLGVKLTFWGVPGDPRHDGQRGWNCLEEFSGCTAANQVSPPPFLVMPTSCQQPYRSTLRGNSWASSAAPSEVAEPVTYTLPEAIDGCNHLPFAPSIEVTPDGTAASTPTGLNVDVHVKQEAVLNAESLAQSAIRNITVALPDGVAVNPAGGDGLMACTEGQVGYEPPPVSEPPESLHFTPDIGGTFCPDASKVGTVEIATPLLPPGQHLKGAVYLASQNENPFGSLIAMYIVAKDPISGAIVKLPGEVHLTGTGQIVSTFKNNPQLAFEDAELHFFGGERAPLRTPARCGTYTTNAVFEPWSGGAPVSSTSAFDVATGPHGGPCPGATLPFSPTLTAGTINNQAGAFSPLTTTISREDGDQDFSAVQLHMPPGLSGVLTGVTLCGEQQANEGTCPASSQIGETTVSAGVGAHPVSVTGGKVYLTEKYAGAPFGVSIVNPVKAGPFDLEHDTANPENQPACDCIVVRAKVEVDLHTAALVVTTDTTGPHKIPSIIDGVPVEIQHINVTIGRPGFTFNPTNCEPLSFAGGLFGVEGGSALVSAPFQATNCATLKFAPKFAVSTSGATSKANGASLRVKLSYPTAPPGSQANIAMVKVSLPKQLPSRLTTLQKACLAAVFDANPANCPAASIVGHAKATTPLLPVPVSGPAYFVSHGGEAFPSLIIVLEGYGVRIQLVGSTFIKGGITSSTFKTVPDVPVGTFELTLPQGKYSALAANGNLCKRKLLMPTSFVAQNGAEIHQNTKIAKTGCHKVKKHKQHKRHGKHKKRGKKHR
jgi:hypothetical protein